MILATIIGIKTYHTYNGIAPKDTRIFYAVCIAGIGIVVGTLFIALAELLINVKQINHKLNRLTYDQCEVTTIRKEG